MRNPLARSAVVMFIVLAAVAVAAPRAALADHLADQVPQAVCTMLAMANQDCGPFTR